MRGRGHQRQVDRSVGLVGREPHHMGYTYGRRPAPVDRPLGPRDMRQTQRRRVGGVVRLRRQAHNRVGHETRRGAHVAATTPAHSGPVHVHGRDAGRGPPVREPVPAHHAAHEHARAVRQGTRVHQPR